MSSIPSIQALSRFKFPRGYSAWSTRGTCRYDVSSAARWIQFTEQFITHSKGKWAGQPLLLETWQRAILANLYGWKRPDDEGTRRYRQCYVRIPRKNGKSTLCAGIALGGLFIDAEPGAEVYGCAADKDQAKIVFSLASESVLRNEALARRSTIYKDAIEVRCPETGIPSAFYRVLSAEAFTKHGLNPHLVVYDELHAAPSRELWDVMRTGMSARQQPLMVAITTAGYDRESICWEQDQLAVHVAEGTIEDEAFLPVLYGAQAHDDWESPKVWAKANPNLGVSKSVEYMRAEATRAKNVPAALNTFLQLELNVWTTQRSRAIDPNAWNACHVPADQWPDLSKCLCFGAADLAHARDLTALVRLWELPEDWPPANDANERGSLADIRVIRGSTLFVRSHFWIPETIAREVEKTHSVPYSTWARQGWLTLTEGDVTDYEHLRREVRAAHATRKLKAFGCDPYNATHLLVLLQDEDGLKNVEKYQQSTANLNEPFKDLVEVRIPQRQIVHDGNPVLAWCASNVEAKKDAGDRWRPVKPQDSPVAKIDGITALVMANGLRIAESRKRSVYETRGVITG
jgi:phage terminase large subunit-like protein